MNGFEPSCGITSLGLDSLSCPCRVPSHVVLQPQIKIGRRPGGIALLERFFVQYPKFLYDPSKPPVAEFKRLCKEYKKDSRHKFNAAIKKEFYDQYGTDEKDINNSVVPCESTRSRTPSKNAAL